MFHEMTEQEQAEQEYKELVKRRLELIKELEQLDIKLVKLRVNYGL